MLYDISVLIIVEHMDYFFYVVESPTNRKNGISYVKWSSEKIIVM